jgi:glucan phosphoethanolaminetransferase (alkaline phosphatase superfamily)
LARGTFIVLLLIAASWSLLLLPWVAVGDQNLTGAELSDLLALLPALAILFLLIALYGRMTRALRVTAAVVLWVGAYLAFSTDFSTVAASIALQESITGIAGESSIGQTLATPTAFGIIQLVLGFLSLALLKTKLGKINRSENYDSDTRGLWESQS